MKFNDTDAFLRQILNKQSENSYEDERGNIDFDAVSAYIENSLPEEEIAEIEKMLSENDVLAETVNATREFLKDDNQNKVTIIPMKKSRNWSSELLRYAAAIIVVAAAATFVTVFIVPEREGVPGTKPAIYQPKRTRSLTQPTSTVYSSIQKTNDTEKVKSEK